MVVALALLAFAATYGGIIASLWANRVSVWTALLGTYVPVALRNPNHSGDNHETR
jgi:hypothetical protein